MSNINQIELNGTTYDLEDTIAIAEIDSLIYDKYKLDPSWDTGYLKNDGTINSGGTYATSELITIPAGCSLVFNSYASTSTYHWANYNSSGVFQSVGCAGLLGRNGIRIDATETRYVKICTNTSNISVDTCNPYLVKISKDVISASEAVSYTNIFPGTGVTYGNGYISSSNNSVTSSDVYRYSSVIYLQKGQSLEFEYSGSSGIWALSEWTRSSSFVQGILQGDLDYHRSIYTADHDMWVRICTRSASGGNYVPTAKFEAWVQYYKGLKQADEKLKEKNVVVIGDSLIYGNLLGNGVTWCQILANETGANVYNYGVNGNAISSVSGGTGTPMSERYSSITELSSADIVIVEGGANDYSNNCPIGTISDSVNSTFMGAINVLIDGIRATNPTAQLLFMTTYNRKSNANSSGLYYVDYVNAMLNACRAKSVPCYDNYANSGITFLDANLASWADEGLYLGHTAQNNHLSPDAYDWLYPKYKAFIELQI